MPEKAEDFYTKNENVAFEKDPEKYCRQIYDEALERNEQLQPINVENTQFYEGVDEKLRARASDPRVRRSSLFIHELTPAIDTRISGAMTKLEQREYPLTCRPANKNATADEKDNALWQELRIGDQLRSCGYYDHTCREQWQGAEILRSPSTVKVGWRRKKINRAVVINGTLEEQLRSLLSFRDPRRRVEWREVEVGEPFVQWLQPDEFLYEPGVSDFNDSTYCIHAMWLDYNDIMVRAVEFKYDTKKIREFREEQEDVAAPDVGHQTTSDEIQESRETPLREGFRDGKYLLTESYVVTYDESGKETVNLAVMIGNKYLVQNEESWAKGIKFPFYPLVINPLSGTIEGLSSIDKGKTMQRLINEAYNSYLDGLTYRIFPPFKNKQGNVLDTQPIYGPAQVWNMLDTEAFKPVIENPGQLPDLPGLIAAISSKIRDLLNAQDISQGFQSQEYEKATSTRLRAAGAARRATPTHKLYGMAIIKIAEMFIKLNQQYDAENGWRFVQDVILDVPSLTNISDPESDKQDAILLLSTMENSPSYQTPLGKKKVRNMWEHLIRQFMKTDVNSFVKSEDEIDEEVRIETEMVNAMQQKQSNQEQMAISNSMAAPGQQAGV